MKRAVLFLATLAVMSAPAAGALAHDDDDDWGYRRHRQDHREHGEFHREAAEAHAQAHEEGFWSPEEHAAYHRALRDMHEGFHEEHPDTRHDHRRWRRAWGYNYGNPYAGGYQYRWSGGW
jgi:Ni/Co efflux regulator RcnB